MIETITSPIGFSSLLVFFAVGAIGSLLLQKDDKLANIWNNFFAILGSLSGIIFSVLVIITGHNLAFNFGSSSFSLLSFSFNIDMLSAFFIFAISLIALFCSVFGIGYIKHFYKKYNIGVLGFFYNLLIGSMILVVTASNGIFFLIAWEIMSVSSYFLVVYDSDERKNIKAGFLYLVMTYIGTSFIVFSFLLIYKYTNSFDFSVIKSNMALIPSSVKNIIFIFGIIGFGTKTGIIPFHIWLPAAHPAAPSHVSALMSGVMIKTGIYMLLRMALDILQPIPVWWGMVIIIIGSVSALLGVLYALTEHDIKKLLAYHSIENIGIILLGLGSAMVFFSLNMVPLALLSLIASLFHTLNHAVFKSLLFLSAGSVINEVHTKNMEEYGGLIKYMPQTAMFFLIGSMAISALPPFNGFFSEWLTFQSLFQGIAQLQSYSQMVFMLAAGSLAFTGGLALACFVKAFGAIFLARPRSEEVTQAKESDTFMRIGMGALALLSILFGLLSGYITILLEKVGRGFSIFNNSSSSVFISSHQVFNINNGFSSVAPFAIFIGIILTILLVIWIIKYNVNKNQKITISKTWDCGTALSPRMEITATGFTRSIILIFRGILKPSIQHDVEYHDAESRYLPKSRAVTLGVENVYNYYFYQPINKIINGLSLRIKNIQTGNINIYISYIFIALIISLFLIL
ncbi:MAG: proton-conducting transporter membrane subunit [Candidatus Pacebacteria bacterium]|nr:proton-conducting transporter membrane subunit [Candidatus Paceibacterota bacterium]